MTSAVGDAAALTKILAEHRWERGTPYWGCPCGERCPEPLKGSAHRTRWMRSHVAEVLTGYVTTARAQAWDEGYEICRVMDMRLAQWRTTRDNPYRSTENTGSVNPYDDGADT
jgi:hypothetical protein